MKTKKKRTYAEGQQIVRLLEQSGLTHKRFAEEFKISLSALQYWVKRIRQMKHKSDSGQTVKFVEIKAKPIVCSTINELNLPGGICLKTERLPEPSYLAELSAEFQRRSLC